MTTPAQQLAFIPLGVLGTRPYRACRPPDCPRSTEPGDRMLLQMLRNGATQALDLGAEEFLPA